MAGSPDHVAEFLRDAAGCSVVMRHAGYEVAFYVDSVSPPRDGLSAWTVDLRPIAMPSDEDKIRDAMTEATEHPGRISGCGRTAPCEPPGRIVTR